MMNRKNQLLISILGLVYAPWGIAGDELVLNAADTAWILTSTGLVLFMTVPGLALFYGGLVRTKNVLSVLIQCFAVTSLVSILWMMVGYSLALTGGGDLQSVLGGSERFWLRGLKADSLIGSLPESVFCMYHLSFAVFAPALMIGGLVERMRFSVLLMLTGLWTLLVYLPVCHWLWGGGWLSQLGAVDFAGGIVVHTTSGAATVAAAWMLGPRRGFPGMLMPPHNLTLTATGAGVLWVGWHGFSAGSALMANGAAGLAMLTTHIAATAGALVWMGIEWIRYGRPTLLGIATGLIAGLGIVSPAAGFIGPVGALILGIVAGTLCFFAIGFVKRRLGIDDALDVFPVHGVGGMIGALLLAPLSLQSMGGAGLPEALDPWLQSGIQLLAVLACGVWSVTMTLMILFVIRRFTPLRVNQDDETEGLDLSAHNGKAYHF